MKEQEQLAFVKGLGYVSFAQLFFVLGARLSALWSSGAAETLSGV